MEQLVDALAPHRVVIHHDFTKAREFGIDRPNARLIPDPKVTGWGTWGLVEAILHALRFSLDHEDCDYVQLLSEGCLPIRPLREFEAYVAADEADINADFIELRRDDLDAWMTYACRAFLPAGSFRHRMARRAKKWYFGPDAKIVPRQSLALLHASNPVPPLVALRRRFAVEFTRLLVEGPGSLSFYSSELRPVVGSTWFGARRHVCEWLLQSAENPRLREFFASLAIVDEHFFPALLASSPFRRAPSNHVISQFDASGHTMHIGMEDIEAMCATGRFFARKFPSDPGAPVRIRALERAAPVLVGVQARRPPLLRAV